MNIQVRQATPSDVQDISSVLLEAARWQEEQATPLWKLDELAAPSTLADVHGGLFYIAQCDGHAAGVVRFQLEDQLFWPDVPSGESTYIHRLAVRRDFAARGVSTALLEWAVVQTHVLRRRFLRLDCDARRPRLRAVYERFAFRHHSDRQVGPYYVARYEYPVSAMTKT